jgi:hypothetical protein
MTADGTVVSTEPAEQSTPDDARDVWVSVALVVGLVVVHLLMALEISTLPDAVFDRLDGIVGRQGATLVIIVLPAVPLALVVLFWARSRPLGVIAACVALGSCLLGYVRFVVFERMLEAGEFDAATRMVSVTQWALLVLLPTLAALAWGIARRRGRAWVPGVLVAGAAAVPLRSVDVDGVTTVATAAMIYAFVLHVVPAVLGGLTCWWLESRQRPA